MSIVRWVAAWSVLVLGVGLLCPVPLREASGGWIADYAKTTDSKTEPLAAGLVTGSVGVLTTPSHTKTSTSCESTGAVGATWNGSQYAHKDDDKAGSLYIRHRYRHNSSGASTLSVTLTSSISVSGAAHQKDTSDSQWWWNSDNYVSEDCTVDIIDLYGNRIPAQVTWSVQSPAQGAGGDAGQQYPHPAPHSSNNNNGTSPPSSTSQFHTYRPLRASGNSSGTVQLPDEPGAKANADASFFCTAWGCVDNAVVTNDVLKLSFTFKSHL